ncbi:hypothetical protein GGR51DRAFT_535096 [Nemania sp. FL0031]|nr:hypothetical protein GGR51DRAFT_535096 [Nemania sp. FL0031]
MASDPAASPEYIGYRLEAFIGAFTALEAIAFALRVWARSLTMKKYDAGDYLVIAALVGQIVASGVAIAIVKTAGVGYHVEYLLETNPKLVTNFLKYLLVISTWYAATESLAKIAICLLYKQLFPQRHIRIVVNITIAVLVVASIAGGSAVLFGCTPFEAHWGTPEEQAQHCIDTEALYIWGSFPNIITDVVMLIIPLPVVIKLHASPGLRFGLIITFLFGSIGLVTSVIRFVVFYNRNLFLDPTYNSVELTIWTVCEPGVYLIAACLLVYRPLLDKLGIFAAVRKVVNSTGGGRKGGLSGGNNGDHNVDLVTIGGSGFKQLAGTNRGSERSTDVIVTTYVDVSWEERGTCKVDTQ